MTAATSQSFEKHAKLFAVVYNKISKGLINNNKSMVRFCYA